nr:hypothetical protein CFP56_34904 [Quercus suber]
MISQPHPFSPDHIYVRVHDRHALLVCPAPLEEDPNLDQTCVSCCVWLSKVGRPREDVERHSSFLSSRENHHFLPGSPRRALAFPCVHVVRSASFVLLSIQDDSSVVSACVLPLPDSHMSKPLCNGGAPAPGRYGNGRRWGNQLGEGGDQGTLEDRRFILYGATGFSSACGKESRASCLRGVMVGWEQRRDWLAHERAS